MLKGGLKLKQASAVLQVPPKELQNLVQFDVVKPTWREGTYLFDESTLFAAKIEFRLKECLGTRVSVLSNLMAAFLAWQQNSNSGKPDYVTFCVRASAEDEPIKLGVPFRALEEDLSERIAQAGLYKDLPRGRKRPGWKKEFLRSLSEAAKELGQVSEEEILRTIRGYRKKNRRLEITVAAEG